MWETLRKEEVLQKLRTKQGVGLTQREVQVRKQKYGNNKLQEKKKETLTAAKSSFRNSLPTRPATAQLRPSFWNK